MSENEQKPEKTEEQDDEHIQLRVADGNSEVYFRVKKTTPLKRLMDAFCKRQGKNPKTMRFLFEGERVNPEDTAESKDMEDGDMLEAHNEQVGGAL